MGVGAVDEVEIDNVLLRRCEMHGEAQGMIARCVCEGGGDGASHTSDYLYRRGGEARKEIFCNPARNGAMEAVQLTGAISGAVQQLAITSYRIHHVANVCGLTAPILDGTIEAQSFPRNPRWFAVYLARPEPNLQFNFAALTESNGFIKSNAEIS